MSTSWSKRGANCKGKQRANVRKREYRDERRAKKRAKSRLKHMLITRDARYPRLQISRYGCAVHTIRKAVCMQKGDKLRLDKHAPRASNANRLIDCKGCLPLRFSLSLGLLGAYKGFSAPSAPRTASLRSAVALAPTLSRWRPFPPPIQLSFPIILFNLSIGVSD